MDEIDRELANCRARRDACGAQLVRLVLERDGEIARLGAEARKIAELRADAESRASSLNAELDKLGRERRAVMTWTPASGRRLLTPTIPVLIAAIAFGFAVAGDRVGALEVIVGLAAVAATGLIGYALENWP
jgi:hypothetical protein